MRKTALILSIILVLPLGFGSNLTENRQFSFENKIKQINPSQVSNGKIHVSLVDSHFLLNSSGHRIYSKSGNLAWDIERLEKQDTTKWLFGTQYGQPKYHIIDDEGNTLSEGPVSTGYDIGAFLSDNLILSGNTFDPRLYYLNSSQNIDLNIRGTFPNPFDSKDFDNDGFEEVLVKGGDPRYLSLIDENGVNWTKNSNIGGNGIYLDDEKFLNMVSDGITVRKNTNGDLLWQKEFEQFSYPDTYNDKILIWANNELKYLNKTAGDTLESYSTEFDADKVKVFRDDKVLASESNSLYLTDLKGNVESKLDFEDDINNFKLYQHDNDSKLEVAVSHGNTVSVLDLNKTNRREVNSLEDRIVYGTGKEVLKALSIDKPVIIADELDDKRIESRTGLEPIKPSRVNWSNVSSGPRYYVDSQEKAVYLSSLISDKNGSVTFSKENSDKDYSNYTVEELKELLIDRQNINHLVLADLDSEKGLLASSIASKYEALPVNSDFYSSEPSIIDTGTINKNSGYTSVESKVEQTFKRIGENKETVFDGRYVSILNAPRKAIKDPIPGAFTNNGDGTLVFTDLDYGNLDSDRHLETAVGRYPSDTKKASLLFLRSRDREIGGKALVSSEYLHSNWPVVLATLGGGVKSGTAAEEILEKQDYEVTHLVEHRSAPVDLLLDLTSVGDLIDNVHKLENGLDGIISSGSAEAVKNGVLIVRGLEYAEEALKIYLEFNWDGYLDDFDPELPESATLEEIKEFVDSVLPDRHPEINSSSLKDRVSKADLVYYSGVGDNESWTMPNEDDAIIKDFYSGENSFEPENLSAKRNSILFDSSNMGGSRKAEIREKFMENGSSYVGFTGVSYHAYSSSIASDFLKHGKTTGNSFKDGVNSLRSSFIVYNPASSYLNGVREKMSNTASLYGNPETSKDPIPRKSVETNRSCSSGTCSLKVSIDPSYTVKNYGENRTLKFENATGHILKPFRPITPIYSYSKKLPNDAEILEKSIGEEYTELSDVSTPELRPLSHGGSAPNGSSNYSSFPKKTYRLNITDRIEYVQTAQQEKGNTTKVLESARLELRYRSPLTLDIEATDSQLYAKMYSKESKKCELYYRKDSGEIQSIDVVLNGEKRLNLEDLGPGEYSIDSAVICDEEAVTDESSVTVERPVEVHLFAPDTGVSEVRKVRGVVENPNDSPVREKIKLEMENNASLNLLEESVRTVKLGPGESEEVSWEIIGLSKGSAKARAGRKDIQFKVVDSHDSITQFNPASIVKDLQSQRAQIKTKVRKGKTVKKIQNYDSALKAIKEGSKVRKTLETPEYKFTEVRRPSNVTRKLDNSNGFYMETVSEGESKIERKSVSKGEYLEKKNIFDREMEKIGRLSYR